MLIENKINIESRQNEYTDELDLEFEKKEQENFIHNEKIDDYPSDDELSSLAVFMDNIEQLKEKNKMKQGDIAKKMNTTQSAVSRLMSAKANPTYKQLASLANAVGGILSLSAFGDFSITAPVDLHNDIKYLAEKEEKSIPDLLQEFLRTTIEKELQYKKQWTVDFSDSLDNTNELFGDLCG